MLNSIIRFALKQRLLVMAAALFLIGYGLFIEAGQYLLGYRFFESADLIADGTGIAIYLLFRDTIPSLPMLDMLRQPLSDN